ncbi:MAG TPA: hypothetical protein VGS19_23785 [Streptosporangiaceae bacterium]|nr:hypothetical protein [Streptosporangiaceae bacterium]
MTPLLALCLNKHQTPAAFGVSVRISQDRRAWVVVEDLDYYAAWQVPQGEGYPLNGCQVSVPEL